MDLTRTNIYFNNHNATNEQELLESLIIESVLMMGMDVYYLPRRLDNFDPLYLTSDLVTFDKAYSIPMYLESVNGFSGEGNLMSKFGLEIRDSCDFVVPRRIFENLVISQEGDIRRPREGDLVYFPLNDKCFQVMYTNNKEVFYALGSLPTYKITCELYEYSNEKFKTGIPAIDKLQKKMSTNILDYAIKDESGEYIKDESGNYITNEKFIPKDINPLDDSEQIQEEYDDIGDFSETNPFGRE